MWFKRKVRVPGEMIYEIIGADENTDFGIAVVEIQESLPHYHADTQEVYVLLEGELEMHVGDEMVILKRPGQSVQIFNPTVHWAKSLNESPARVLVVTMPAWSSEDHFLI